MDHPVSVRDRRLASPGYIERSPIVLIIAVQIACLNGCQRVAGQANAEGREFDAARELVVRGKYQEAITALSDFVDQHGNSKQASRAGLFLFKAYAATDDLENAQRWCQWTIEKHPASLEAHKCRYKSAMIKLWKGDVASARVQFDRLADGAAGPLAAEAAAMRRYLDGLQPR